MVSMPKYTYVPYNNARNILSHKYYTDTGNTFSELIIYKENTNVVCE